MIPTLNNITITPNAMPAMAMRTINLENFRFD
jgi:hypothetical protein